MDNEARVAKAIFEGVVGLFKIFFGLIRLIIWGVRVYLVQIALIVITDQIDLIASPASGILRIIKIDISASPFVAFSQQVRENASGCG